MRMIEVLLVISTLLGPVLAVQAQKWVERATERFGLWHYQTNRERDVVDRWREYTDVLNEPAATNNEAAARWLERADDRYLTLLQTIATALGYLYDKAQLRCGIYYPRGFSEAERRQESMQHALLRVLTGQQHLTMNVAEFPQRPEEATAPQLELQRQLLRALERGVLRIEIVPPQE
jgi:hypothetical protein